MRTAARFAASLALAAALGARGGDANAEGGEARAAAHVGYAYPAGARRGMVVQILTGGQNLRGASAACFSGEGVKATVLRHVRPLSPQQMQELRRRLADAAEFRRTGHRVVRPVDPDDVPPELPDHPLLRDLETKSAKELRAISTRFLGAGRRRQMNSQIAETVEIEVTVDADAAPGDRELRLVTAAGLTNPVRFQVGALPEIAEEEARGAESEGSPRLDLPVLVNGQILPGDADRFRFRARRGDHLVVDASARRLIPYLADAVPGWFQATATLFDARGAEVAYSDDFRFEPDPSIAFDVPADGEYVLEIRDALYRGREDFVYRVAIADVRRAPAKRAALAASDLPVCDETEGAGDAEAAQPITVPVVVDGRIGRPGDTDTFEFEVRAGEDVVAEVVARRAGSPLDSLLTATDATGRVLGWNDDHDDPASGLVTHQADSYVRFRPDADGISRVRIADAQRHGGAEFSYRLRVGPPRPGFRAFVTPSSLSIDAGGAAPLDVRVVREDGFDGPVELVLTDAPPGIALGYAKLAAGATSARVTLAARDATDGPIVLHFEARAQIGGSDVRRPATPADDLMQAFASRHLVPAQEFMVVVQRRGRAPRR